MSSLQNPVIINAANVNSGTYTVVVTGSNGCTASATANLSVQNNLTFYADADNDGYGTASNSQQSCAWLPETLLHQ